MGDAAVSLDLTGQFMATLHETLQRLALMYPDCPKTVAHVSEFGRHVHEARTRERSIRWWHRSMERHYVSVAQTRDEERMRKSMYQAMQDNWFFAQMDMAPKWEDASFDPSRERFVHAIRVLNGLAFMQNSFLGKMTEAFNSIAERLAGRDPMAALSSETVMEMVPQLLELINPNTLMEINRMLPHVAYVLGGKEKLVGMLDETLGEAGTMKPMILEMLGTLMPAMKGMGGFDDGSAEGEGSAMPAPEEFVARSTATVRDIIEKIADPDNENSLSEVLESFGISGDAANKLFSGAAGEGGEAGGVNLNPEDIVRAFEGFRETMGEHGEALGAIGSLLSDRLSSGTVDTEELTAMATEALRIKGIELEDTQLEAVRNLTATLQRAVSNDEATEGEAAGEAQETEE